ncbi:lytic murein transglycosylase B [Dasania marina]|uniref:lytic murein transglycosylase B n=1 Tax=Dasania marina TaxID=471499 RepID=UPI0030D89BF8
MGKKMRKKTVVKIAMSAMVLCLSASLQANYKNHEQAQVFVQRMVSEHGFDKAYVNDLLSKAERKQSILDAISRPAEKVLTWKDYRKIFLDERRIAQGREFLQTYKVPLARAEQQFGVPANIIAAIIGVETRYGHHKGKHRVLDALATLAFDYPPRSTFFTSELEQYLLLVKEQGFKAEELMGSYAGAMGFGQFISSSYRHYSVDFDGDDVADIINNPIDAIGSVANYFNKHGWQAGEAVTVTARINDKTNRMLANQALKPTLSLQDLATGGYQADFNVAANSLATAMILQGEQGDEAWIGFKNFYVITRYNHSALYAMAVFQLSESIK